MSTFAPAPMAWLERQLSDAAKDGIILSMADIEERYMQLSNNDDLMHSPELRRQFNHMIKCMMKLKFDFVQRQTDILIPKQYGYKELPSIDISPSRSASVSFQAFQPTSFDSEMYFNMVLVTQMLRTEIKQNVNSISEEQRLRKQRNMPSYSSLQVFLDLMLTENANEFYHCCQEEKGEVYLVRKNVISYLFDQLKSR